MAFGYPHDRPSRLGDELHRILEPIRRPVGRQSTRPLLHDRRDRSGCPDAVFGDPSERCSKTSGRSFGEIAVGVRARTQGARRLGGEADLTGESSLDRIAARFAFEIVVHTEHGAAITRGRVTVSRTIGAARLACDSPERSGCERQRCSSSMVRVEPAIGIR
ncbi:MAG TPA: hypothetical protein VM328_07495 [Fimbriimonadaceae bacterium]|jgi:hypothetical protein|nr:hypothetical protein [Fimbriimonadaceae bacterium]